MFTFYPFQKKILNVYFIVLKLLYVPGYFACTEVSGIGVQCLQSPEKGARAPGTDVIVACDLLCGC